MPTILADTDAAKPKTDYTVNISGILLWNEQRENETLRAFAGTIFPLSSVKRPLLSSDVKLIGMTTKASILEQGLVKGRNFREFVRSRVKSIFLLTPDIQDIIVMEGKDVSKPSTFDDLLKSLKTFGIIVIVILALYLGIRIAGLFK